MTATWQGLVSALQGAPRLQDALCRGRGQEHDNTDDPKTIAACISRCNRCPCLAACRAWADDQPENSLVGVVGAELHVWRGPVRQKRAS